MDSGFKQSITTGRIDVSQLDKVNAIPNKTTDNVLMDGLSPEDQLYLSILMEDSSSDSDDEDNVSRRSSAWSPMAQSPTIMNKRIKKLRPPSAVTLSLEDISYIRPSWGISKSVKRIEVNKRNVKPDGVKKKEASEKKSNRLTYHCFLFMLILLIGLMILMTYIVDVYRSNNKIYTNKIKIDARAKMFELYKPTPSELSTNHPILRVEFGQGIPKNLKPDACTCAIFDSETHLYDPAATSVGNCYSCLDWASRANFRLSVVKDTDDEDIPCYNVQWQSYDTLSTPLIDCFRLGDELWFGLGDLMNPSWPLNKLESDWITVVSNLSSEFGISDTSKIDIMSNLSFGSMVNFSLISTDGVHIHNLRTDFQPSIQISQDAKTGTKKLCLTATCTDRCTKTWSRFDKLPQYRYHNNILEYTICSSVDWRNLISKQYRDRAQRLTFWQQSSESSRLTDLTKQHSEIALEIESSRIEKLTTSKDVEKSDLPEGVGLIERAIFATSLEFFPILDGQTLRQFVDTIVKLGLKTSSILLIDSRWQTYAGSLRLNVALFPKAKLLFEILHNKGFKIVLSLKPYVDSGIGINNINQLLDSGRIYKVRYEKGGKYRLSHDKSSNFTGHIIRRKSLLSFKNETIISDIDGSERAPYLSRCRESPEGHCVLLDITTLKNREWFAELIKRNSFLTQEADGIQIAGAHPDAYDWDDNYRSSLGSLIDKLMFEEKIYTIPQWTGNFNYIQLAPRRCDWDSLRSVLNSVINLGTIGYSLIHPGSVWGDVKQSPIKQTAPSDTIFVPDLQSPERSDEELIIRWLQVSIFMPVLQFNNIAPIEKYGLQELLQNLIKIRKLHIIGELKKHLPLTPLVAETLKHQPTGSEQAQTQRLSPLIRPVFLASDTSESVVPEQFLVGPDVLVAPILGEAQRQRDIYLPSGFWHDELRQINIRGGKWLRNYPIELNEIAWFTRAKR